MADYIYLLETRLSKAQRAALEVVREVARGRGLTVFLVGGAVRDLTSGSLVRDLDVVVQGNALKLKKDLEKSGARISSEMEAGQALFLFFPGGVRVEVGSTLSASYPKPGKVVLKPGSLQEDLRRRDFTANAMALSLNDGSYGLLMDPLNGVADIENRELRLVSNYGFLEDPVRMIRAARLMARLGWQMEERTRTRYDNSKEENLIEVMGEFARGYETEEIFHEEEPLRVMRRLEEEGWMAHLFPALSAAKANVAELERLRETQMQLQIQGIHADAAAANFPLLTAKLSGAELSRLKAMFPRQGFVGRIDALDAEAREFTAQMLAKTAAAPSQAYQLIHGATPEAVLWAAHTTKSAALQAKFKSFYSDWPQARQKIPHGLMQEMRITPEVAQYEELLQRVYFELMDGRLQIPEEMRAFLEPYSPPAPPPPVHLRRPRAAKKDAKAKGRKKVVQDDDLEEVSGPEADADLDGIEAGEEPQATRPEPIGKDLEGESGEDVPEAEDDIPEVKAAPVNAAPVKATPVKAAPVKAAPVRPQPGSKAAVAMQPMLAKSTPMKAVPAKAVPAKVAPAKAVPAKATTVNAVPVKAVAAKAPPAKVVTAKATKPSLKAAAATTEKKKPATVPAKGTGKKMAQATSGLKKGVAPAKMPLKGVGAKGSAAQKTAPGKKVAPAKVAAGKSKAATNGAAKGRSATPARNVTMPGKKAGSSIPMKPAATKKSKKGR